MNKYYLNSKEELFKKFNSSEKGLSLKQAKLKLKKYGLNIIQKTSRLSPLKILFEQFNSLLIYILLISSIILFFINQLLDAIVIVAIVLFNTSIGFFQQYKAEKAILSLRKMIVSKTTVLRDGRYIKISSSKIVPGDIIILNNGDKINADARIIEAQNLQTNEAALTGESLPVEKNSENISKKLSLAEQKNMVFTGTQIVKGNAKALVVATGKNSVFGNIAETLQKIEVSKTPMQKRLDKFSKQLSIIIFTFASLIVFLGVLQNFSFFDMFLTAVALAVGAIPEGLPAVLAATFAISSVVLSKNNVIIRRLPAVETLGSVSVICSDKTGTITEEKMEIQKIFANGNFYSKKDNSLFLKNKKINVKSSKELSALIKTSILCNNARFEIIKGKYDYIGNPTENALLTNAIELDFNKKELTEKEPSIEKIEFDSKRKMMSIARNNGKEIILYSKGAPEKIIEKSDFELINGKRKKLSEKRKKQLLKKSREMEKNALRVLGFAYKSLDKKENIEENSLVFLGFMGMIDPPRKEVKDAVNLCKKAGIKIKIITGDSALTAKAIAKQIGISGRIITEEELKKLSDAELLEEIDEIAIFARTTPQQKLRITKLLQNKKEIVAITGDGVNDVLALKSADIGLAMGQRGTDVARDVSDIIIADDNFASIVQGVKQGRRTYDNIKKFAKYMLSVNFSEILLITFSIIMASLFGQNIWYLPLLPLQILWINLITDSFPALALAFEKDENVLKTKPRKEKSLLEGIWKFIIIAGLFTLLIKLIAYLIGIEQNFSPEKTRTIVLTTAVFFEMLFVYTCRSEKFILNKNLFSNKWLNYAVLLSFLLHFILLYTSLGNLFGVVALTELFDWLIIIPLSLSGLIVFELGKLLKNKIRKVNNPD